MSWDERYKAAGYLFGTEPNAFLKRCEDYFRPGQRVLSVADGEGRNSVWLAERGVRVTAIESSVIALAKAHRLAAERRVQVEFLQADVLTWEWPRASFDAVVGVFIQFVGPEQRALLFSRMAESLKPGGLLLLHGYTPKQLVFRTGGPPTEENLYTSAMLASAFAGFDVLELREYETEIQEGTGHAGMSALIDLVARSPR